jgi:hypothetical protein
VTVAQAPVVPDASSLAGLEPSVALAFLGVIALGMLLFYFGKPLQDRVRGAKASPPATDPASTGPIPPVLPSSVAALDRATEMTNRLITALEEQARERDEEIERIRHERDETRRELERTRMDLERCRDQWRRP